MEYVVDMPQKQISELAKTITNILNCEEKFNPTFTIDNIEFGFIPNFDNITGGEMADIEAYLYDVQTVHRALSVLFRPITNKKKDLYEIAKYKGSDAYANIMKHAPLSILSGASVFFSTLQNDLLSYILKSMKEVELHPKQEQILVKNGIGMQTFTQLLEEITLKSERQQRKIYTRYSLS